MRNEYQILDTEILLCDGGEYSFRYPTSHIQSLEDSVYCARSNICNLILKIKEPQCAVKDITITAPPRSGYTNPVEHVAIFFSIGNHYLIDRANDFLANSEITEVLFNPPRSSDAKNRGKLLPLEKDGYTRVFSSSTLKKSEVDMCPITYKSMIPSYDENRSLELDDCTTDSLSPTCRISTPLTPGRYTYENEVLTPVILGTISNWNSARQLRAEFETPITANYLVVRLTNAFMNGGNVDIESIILRGTVGSGNEAMEIR